MVLLREIASSGWDKSVTLNQEVRSEMDELRSLIAENAFCSPQVRSPVEITVEGDASDDLAAYIIYRESQVLTGLIRPTHAEHIFLSELDIAIEGCLKAYDMGYRGVEYRGDNMPSLVAIKKRLSSNFTANRRLSRLPADLTIATTYVPSAENLADPFTRGAYLPTLPSTMQEVKLIHERFRATPFNAPNGLGPRRA